MNCHPDRSEAYVRKIYDSIVYFADVIAFYNTYRVTYLERDVRSLSNVGSLRDFERFIRACALRSQVC